MRGGAGVFDVAPDPPGYEEHSRNAYQEIEPVKPGLQRVVFIPLLAQFLADICKGETPG